MSLSRKSGCSWYIEVPSVTLFYLVLMEAILLWVFLLDFLISLAEKGFFVLEVKEFFAWEAIPMIKHHYESLYRDKHKNNLLSPFFLRSGESYFPALYYENNIMWFTFLQRNEIIDADTSMNRSHCIPQSCSSGWLAVFANTKAQDILYLHSYLLIIHTLTICCKSCRDFFSHCLKSFQRAIREHDRRLLSSQYIHFVISALEAFFSQVKWWSRIIRFASCSFSFDFQ
jgi:hypothetical protein